MTIPQKIIKFLEKNKIKYTPLEHRTVYTAFDKAATLRVPQKIIGKTLVVKTDKTVALVLIPANKNLDKQKLKKIAKPSQVLRGKIWAGKVKTIDFIKEVWIKKNLKGVKVGAIPPFGNLWKLPTFTDKSLLQNPKIIVNGGDYNCSIKISPAVFKKIVPDLVVGSFSQAKK